MWLSIEGKKCPLPNFLEPRWMACGCSRGRPSKVSRWTQKSDTGTSARELRRSPLDFKIYTLMFDSEPQWETKNISSEIRNTETFRSIRFLRPRIRQSRRGRSQVDVTSSNGIPTGWQSTGRETDTQRVAWKASETHGNAGPGTVRLLSGHLVNRFCKLVTWTLANDKKSLSCEPGIKHHDDTIQLPQLLNSASSRPSNPAPTHRFLRKTSLYPTLSRAAGETSGPQLEHGSLVPSRVGTGSPPVPGTKLEVQPKGFDSVLPLKHDAITDRLDTLGKGPGLRTASTKADSSWTRLAGLLRRDVGFLEDPTLVLWGLARKAQDPHVLARKYSWSATCGHLRHCVAP